MMNPEEVAKVVASDWPKKALYVQRARAAVFLAGDGSERALQEIAYALAAMDAQTAAPKAKISFELRGTNGYVRRFVTEDVAIAAFDKMPVMDNIDTTLCKIASTEQTIRTRQRLRPVGAKTGDSQEK